MSVRTTFEGGIAQKPKNFENYPFALRLATLQSALIRIFCVQAVKYTIELLTKKLQLAPV